MNMPLEALPTDQLGKACLSPASEIDSSLNVLIYLFSVFHASNNTIVLVKVNTLIFALLKPWY